MKSSEIDVAESAPTTPGVTRRDFVAGSVGLGTLSAVSAIAPQAAAAGAPATVVLVNEPYLRKRYPHDAASLLDSVGRFAQQQNGEIVRLDGNETAAAIKARLQRLSRRPKRLVIFGDEGGIPRFAVKAPGVDIQVDWFYGDLDGDGLAEVAISRVLGGPRAMANQLGEPSGESYRGRLITYRGPRDVVGEVRQVGVDAWIENNHEGSGRFQAVSETDSEIVLQKRDNNIQFKLDLAARKTFWRRSNEEAWRHNYDIVEIMRTDDRSPTAAPYERIVYRRPEGPKTYFGVVRRLGSGQWIEINNDGSNRYQTVSETASEIVLHNRSNDIQFKLDLVARKCFWRRGTRENWKPNYDIIEMETNGAAGRAAASGALPVLAFTSGPQVHLEGNALATVIGDFGGRFENRDWPDLQLLARAGAIYFCGHGNPDGWYGGITGTIVTAPSVPELPGRPIVFAATCSTASPEAAIARTFMDRVAASTSARCRIHSAIRRRRTGIS